MKTEKPGKPAKPKPAPLSADFNPRFATPDEVAAYCRVSRRVVERRMRDGTYESFLAGPNKRLIVFATVVDDIERRLAAGAQFDRPLAPGKGARGRRKKPQPENQSAAEAAAK
jgi:hypothetical protein